MGSPNDVDAGSTDVEVAYNAQAGTACVDSKGNTGNQQKQTRKRWIMIGAAVAVAIAVIVVIVVVVTQTTKSDDGEESKYSKECGPFKLPGLNFSDLSPTVISRSHNIKCPLKGDCWSGEKCFQCFKLETWKVGNINYIPVCCPDCLVRGLRISSSECNCRFNGR